MATSMNNLSPKESDSPFLRLPREVRDKIYDELLIARLNPTDQLVDDQIVAATSTPLGDFGRENALNYYNQEICLMPGGNKGYPFIMQAMGLLLANKQIHEEANNTLFSKNLFFIPVEWERVYPFWRCDNPGCYPPESPCFVMFEYFKNIKHLYIQINNLRAMTDPAINIESARLNQNLKTVARCFREGGNKLKTLKIRYTSCFDGQIDAVRDSLEDELPEGMPERKTMLKDRHGKYHYVSRAEAPFFAKKKREMEEAERKKRQEQDKGSRFRAFIKEMVEKNKGTANETWYRDMLKVSAKSPAVMADLMRPPTQEDIERYRRERAARQTTPGPAQSAGSFTSIGNSGGFIEDEEVDDASGGIGMIDGKPVFGSPRPPGLL